jgi:hypothetical protein
VKKTARVSPKVKRTGEEEQHAGCRGKGHVAHFFVMLDLCIVDTKPWDGQKGLWERSRGGVRRCKRGEKFSKTAAALREGHVEAYTALHGLTALDASINTHFNALNSHRNRFCWLLMRVSGVLTFFEGKCTVISVMLISLLTCKRGFYLVRCDDATIKKLLY